jgi:toxin ParE1/3/4
MDQADHYVNLLLDEMEDIAANSHRGFEQNYSGTKFLFSQVESHLIFYRRLADNTDIEVIRVLHKRMDIPNRLFD